jgi:hypothetical protein
VSGREIVEFRIHAPDKHVGGPRREQGNVNQSALDLLLKSMILLTKSGILNLFSKGPHEQGWQDIQKVITVNDALGCVVDGLTENEEVWHAYSNDLAPETIDF